MSDEQTKDDALIPRQAQFLTRRSAALVRRGLGEALTPQSAAAYYSRGYRRWNEGDLDGAVGDYNNAIGIDPQYDLSYKDRGWAKRHEGYFDREIDDYDKAIEINPGSFPPAPWAWAGAAYINWGNAKHDKGDFDGAIAAYDKAIGIDPESDAAYNNRGLAKKDTGNLDGAIADYDKAIELDSRNALAYKNRGVAKWYKGDLDGARADRTKAIEIDPEIPLLPDSTKLMLETIVPSRRFDLEMLDLIQKMAANRVEAGITTVDGLVDAVHEAVSEAVPGTSKQEVREAISGYGYGWENGWREIEKRLRELESEVPQDKAAISSLMQASETIGEDLAVLSDVLETLSSGYRRIGHFKESADVVEIMIELIPRQFLLHHLLGCTYEALEWWSLAERAYRDELKLDPDNEEAKSALEKVKKRATERGE